MPTTVNLLPWHDALLTRDDSGAAVTLANTIYPFGWTADNATLEISQTDLNVTSRFAAVASPSTSQKVTYKLRNVELPLNLNGSGIVFNAKIKTVNEVSVETTLWVDSASAIFYVDPSTNIAQSASSTVFFPVDGVVTPIPSGRYNGIWSNVAYIPNDTSTHYANINIEVSGHDTTPIRLTNTHLIRELGFYENPFVPQFRHYLPDFYWSIDSDQESPSYPFYRLLDILSAYAGDARREFQRMYGYESDELPSPEIKTEYWAASSLVSPKAVRDDYTSWLAQFTGESLKQNLRLDDNSLYLDNYALVRDFIEWQLSTSHYGRAAGSRESILEAAKQVLIKTKNGAQSTKSVSLTPRFGGDPWAIRIQTIVNETIDAEIGESSNIVLASIEQSRPMGYFVTHLTVLEFLLALDDITLGVLGDYPLG